MTTTDVASPDPLVTQATHPLPSDRSPYVIVLALLVLILGAQGLVGSRNAGEVQ